LEESGSRIARGKSNLALWDGLHMNDWGYNDWGYACFAKAIGTAITEAVSARPESSRFHAPAPSVSVALRLPEKNSLS
jgi:hypothetical protein